MSKASASTYVRGISIYFDCVRNVCTWEKLPQAHMYMESEYILIVSKIIVIKHHTLTMDNS